MSDRVEERFGESMLAYADVENLLLLGIVCNVSKNGVFINTHKLLAPNSSVYFVLAKDEMLIPVSGEVRWFRRSEEEYSEYMPNGMGLRLDEPPREYVEYVNRMHCKEC
ncbi:MAG: hypothetical protein GY765_19670 [bacterium]|nr:hypothetical protein [bacterium]